MSGDGAAFRCATVGCRVVGIHDRVACDVSGDQPTPADLPLREVFGVTRRGWMIPRGPVDREGCEALIAEDPDLVLVHYFATDWAEVSS